MKTTPQARACQSRNSREDNGKRGDRIARCWYQFLGRLPEFARPAQDVAKQTSDRSSGIGLLCSPEYRQQQLTRTDPGSSLGNDDLDHQKCLNALTQLVSGVWQ
jgi:hypothetical protein